MATRKLFVSYRRLSWSFTYWLVEELHELLDAEIFVDYSSIDETDFESSILHNLAESDAVLLIVSEHTFDPARIHRDNDWVRSEIREALNLHKPIALACHNGLFPPADLPDDIQGIRKSQGIEFYPRFFKAGVQELAMFLDKATPIKLKTELEPPPEPLVDIKPSQKTLLNRATSLHESGKYDEAIAIYEQLIAEDYKPRLISVAELRERAISERAAEQQRWQAGEVYDEIVGLFRVDPKRAAEEYIKFQQAYPEFTEDPAQLSKKLRASNESVSSNPKALASKPDVSEALASEWSVVARLKGHGKQINGVAFSRDGSVLASCSGGEIFLGDNSVRLWGVDERRELLVLRGHSGAVNKVAYSPDSVLVVSGSSDGTVRVWRPSSILNLLASLKGHSAPVNSVAFAPNGQLIASAGNDNAVRLWKGQHNIWETMAVLGGYSARVNDVAFNRNSTLLACGVGDSTIRVWNVSPPKELLILRGHRAGVNTIVFSPNNDLLASGSDDRTVRIWSVAEQRELALFKGHTKPVRSVAFSLDGTLLASGGDDKELRLWSLSRSQELTILKGHTAAIRCLAFNPDTSLIASAGDDKVILLWSHK